MRIARTQFSLEFSSLEIYISGCKPPHCSGCYNSELWDFDYGTKLKNEHFETFKYKLNRDNELFKNIFILGGEPLDQNIEELIDLLNFLNQFDKKIWLFTRYEKEQVDERIFKYVDYLKTGKYDSSLKTETNIQYGITLATSNQNIYKIRCLENDQTVSIYLNKLSEMSRSKELCTR